MVDDDDDDDVGLDGGREALGFFGWEEDAEGVQGSVVAWDGPEGDTITGGLYYIVFGAISLPRASTM